MAPRASHRRGSRAPSRDPETSTTPSPGRLQRLNLPELGGTPSSRRQYSYGAPVEPLPARPGRHLRRGQVMDLSTAVRESIIRQDQEETEQTRHLADAEEDELAGNPMPPPPQPSLPREPRASALNPSAVPSSLQEEAFPDDSRSFATESSYYGDATIISSSSPARGPPSSRGPAPARGPSTLVPPFSANLEPPSQRQTGQSPVPDDAEEPTTRNTRASSRLLDAEQGEVSPQRAPALQNTINTPAAKRTTANLPVGVKPTTERPPATSPQGPGGVPRGLSRRSRGRRFVLSDDEDDNNANKPAPAPANSGAATQKTTVGTNTEPTTTSRSARRGTSLSRPGRNRGLFPTDASEQDDAMQREIERAEAEAAKEERARSAERRKREEKERKAKEREEAARARREKWDQWRTWVKSQPPLSFFQPNPQNEPHGGGDGQEGEQRIPIPPERIAPLRIALEQIAAAENPPPPVDRDYNHPLHNDQRSRWTLLIDPTTYVEAANWVFQKTIIAFLQWLWITVETFLDQHPVLTRRLGAVADMLPTLLLVLTMALLGPYVYRNFPNDMSQLADLRDNSLESLRDFGNTVGSYVPTFSWPSSQPLSSRWDDIAELRGLDESERESLQRMLLSFERELRGLKKTEKLQDDSIKKLNAVLPKIIHVNKRDGKVVIDQDFWHALRDLLVEDGTFLSLNRKGKRFEVASDQQWQAIVSRLENDATFQKKLGSSVNEAEQRVHRHWKNNWEDWVKSNRGKVAKILGPELEKALDTGSDKLAIKRLEKQLKDLGNRSSGKDKGDGQVMTRAEFLRYLEGEFATHSAEIREQLEEQRPQLEELIKDTVKLATGELPQSMSRDEIKVLVGELVRKSIADMELAAMAGGEIRAHWNKELKHQVNYFSLGAGATIDPFQSSVTYLSDVRKLRKTAQVERVLKEKGVYGVNPLPQAAAISTWFDEGDCWCGVHAGKDGKRGTRLSIQMGHSVTPRTVVMEHILSGATTDPGAAPRDIELWAYIADPKVREATRSFSHAQFAGFRKADEEADGDHMFNAPPLEPLPDRFVRIARFVYGGPVTERRDGVHVHRLSPEIAKLGVQTDQIIVRAITNQGGLDHTCFYRVRLYGDAVGEGENPEGLYGIH